MKRVSFCSVASLRFINFHRMLRKRWKLEKRQKIKTKNRIDISRIERTTKSQMWDQQNVTAKETACCCKWIFPFELHWLRLIRHLHKDWRSCSLCHLFLGSSSYEWRHKKHSIMLSFQRFCWTAVPLLGPSILLFWTSGDVCLDFNAREDTWLVFFNGFLRLTCGAIVGLLMVSMAGFLIHILVHVCNMANYIRLFHRTTYTVIDRNVNSVTGCCLRSITRMFVRDVT